MAEWKYTGKVKKVLIEKHSSDCTTPEPKPQWSSSTTCVGFDKYALWTSTNGETRIGELIENNSIDCGYTPPDAETKYRWVQYDTFCDGNDLRAIEKKQKCIITNTCDCGDESNCWEDVLDKNGNLVTRNGKIVEKDGCYTPQSQAKYRWVLNCDTYQKQSGDGTTWVDVEETQEIGENAAVRWICKNGGILCENCNSYEQLKQQKCIVTDTCECLETDSPVTSDTSCWKDVLVNGVLKTKRGNLIKANDIDCEGCGETGTKYRWVQYNTFCDGNDLRAIEKKQKCTITDTCKCSSDDPIDSICWEDMYDEERNLITRPTTVIEHNYNGCTCEREFERWVKDGFICDDCEKYVKLKKQKGVSNDCCDTYQKQSGDGTTWVDVEETEDIGEDASVRWICKKNDSEEEHEVTINWHDVIPEETKKGSSKGVDKLYCGCVCSFALDTVAKSVIFYYLDNDERYIEIATVKTINGRATLPKDILYQFMLSQNLNDLTTVYAEPQIEGANKQEVECSNE